MLRYKWQKDFANNIREMDGKELIDTYRSLLQEKPQGGMRKRTPWMLDHIEQYLIQKL